jgi:hypothetical protein
MSYLFKNSTAIYMPQISYLINYTAKKKKKKKEEEEEEEERKRKSLFFFLFFSFLTLM